MGGDNTTLIMAFLPKVPAFISMISSYIIIRETTTDLRQREQPLVARRQQTQQASTPATATISSNATTTQTTTTSTSTYTVPVYYQCCRPLTRTLLAMSVGDIFFSFPWFMTNWMMPPRFPGDSFSYIYPGTVKTCTLQATVFTIGWVAVPCFNATYLLFSLLMIRHRWRESQLTNLEPYFHSVIWTMAIGFADWPIFLDLYNPAATICWIGGYPLGCKDSFRYGTTKADCLRGDNGWLLALIFLVFPTWVCYFISFILMVVIFRTVRRLEKRQSRYSFPERSTRSLQRNGNLSRDFFERSISPFQRQISTSGGDLDDSGGHTDSEGLGNIDATTRTTGSRVDDSGSIDCATSQGKNESQGLDGSVRPTLSQLPITSQDHGTSTNTVSSVMQPVGINRSKSKAVGTRALWFALAFLWTYLMDNIVVMMWYTSGMWIKGLAFIAALVFPLQGFVNLSIFIQRRKRMTTQEGQFARRILCFLGNTSICWQKFCCYRFWGKEGNTDSQQNERLNDTTRNTNDFAVNEEESRIFQVLGTEE